MADIGSLFKEGDQQWDEVRRILTKASVAPSEPVPLLTGAEMETLFGFYRTYHRIMEETGLMPKAATVRL